MKRKRSQLELRLTRGWGGQRKGAGRKAAGPRRLPHERRPVHKGRHPVHVTVRARHGLPSFRKQRIHGVIAGVLRDQRKRRYANDFRVVHFSIQSNHVHLIVEADTEKAGEEGYAALRAGISGFEIAVARRLNKLLSRTGSVWADRYHRRDLKTPREVWNGLAYVFGNYTHHGEWSYGDGVVDIHSSAWRFDGWDRPPFTFEESSEWSWPVCAAETWLLGTGYLTHGHLPLVTVHPPAAVAASA
jgi:hypothetical protein